MTTLPKEVVDNYNIDGVNLDYIRARGFCQTTYCQDDYAIKYPGRNLLADIENGAYEYLADWNYNAVTDIVSQVRSKCALVDPNLPISICGHLVLDADREAAAYANQGRDGKRWCNAGLVDFVLNMDYRMRPDYSHLRECLPEFAGGYQGKAGFIIGNYESDGSSRDAAYTALLLRFAQRMKTGIVACYIYSKLCSEQIDAIKAGPFKDEATPY